MFATFDSGLVIPEWQVVQQVIKHSRQEQPAAWAKFAACRAVEIYTDGSAPLRNPGGPAGFATVVVGFGQPPNATNDASSEIYLDLGGFIPARPAEPATSNNRAEIAGVLAAWLLLPQLGQGPWTQRPVTIWSDSNYTVYCGNGTWQRKKNTDLWPIFDRLALEARKMLAGGVNLEWIKGHAGNRYNGRADELATRAAFNFDAEAVARYRAAQAATGQEMPGAAALKQATLPAEADSSVESDYTLILHTRLDSSGQPSPLRDRGIGLYQVVARDGRTRQTEITHPGAQAIDEAEYHTLNAALDDLIGRISAAGRDPADYTVTVYSHQELVVKQLLGEYRVKAAALQAPYAAAGDRIRRFKTVALVWKRAEEIKPLFGRR